MARKSRKNNALSESINLVEEVKRYKVAAYTRLSVEDSGKGTSDTIENQKSFIMEFIDKQTDMDFVDLFCDNGATGVNFDRPEFERMMNGIKSGEIDCIVVKDLSRFGRNYIETGNYLERVFPFLGVRFIAITDNFDTLTAEKNDDGYIIPLKNLINSIYAKDISKKVGSALKAKQKNGEFIGAWAAYGYLKNPLNKNHIVVDDETAHIVRDIYLWKAEGLSVQLIVRKLESLNIPSPSKYRYQLGIMKQERFNHIPWQTTTVKTMLSNPVYLGHLVQGKKKESLFANEKQRVTSKEEWIIVNNTHEPIIEQELFDKVQVMLNSSLQAYNEKLGKFDTVPKTENLLKSIIFCGECGTKLTRYKNVRAVKNKDTKYRVSYTYICPTRVQYMNTNCCTGISEKTVLNAVEQTLRKQIQLVADIKSCLKKAKKTNVYQLKANTYQNQKRRIETKLKDISKYRKGLFESYYSKAITESEYLSLSEQYEQEEMKLKQDLDELQNTHSSMLQYSDDNSTWIETSLAFEKQPLNREMILALVEKIIVHSNKEISIFLKYQEEYLSTLRYLEMVAHHE